MEAADPQAPIVVYKIGRKADDFVLYRDILFYLEDHELPPKSAKANGTIIEGQDVVVSGGQTVFVKVTWLRQHAPHALEGRRYEEDTTLPFPVRQFASLLDSVKRTKPTDERDKLQKFIDKAKESKNLRTTVVKCCLKKRTRDHAILPKIKELVEYNAKVTHRTGLMLNYIALKALDPRVVTTKMRVRDDGLVSLDIEENQLRDLPDFTNQTFIDHAMVMDVDNPHIARAVDEVFRFYPPISVPYMCGKPAAQSSRKTVIANVKTYVNFTYKAHQKRYLVAW